MSNKEIELIEFINKKIDVLNKVNNDLKVAAKNDLDFNNALANNYCAGYDAAIRDFKLILLKLLKGETVVYDEKESSKTY